MSAGSIPILYKFIAKLTKLVHLVKTVRVRRIQESLDASFARHYRYLVPGDPDDRPHKRPAIDGSDPAPHSAGVRRASFPGTS